MLFRASVEVIITAGVKKYSLFPESLRVESSWDNLTDFASFDVARRYRLEDQEITIGESGLFSRGDKVEILWGYNNRTESIFKGFISKISPNIPVRFECEDDMYLLKQKTITFSKDSAMLSDVISEVAKVGEVEVNTHGLDMQIGDFRTTGKPSVSKVLQSLRKYGIYSFFRDGVLNVFLGFPPSLQKTVLFEFGKNVISDSLDYMKSEDVKMRVRAISYLDDNTTIEVTIPSNTEDSSDYSEATRSYYNIKSKSDLEKVATEELEKVNFTGFRGSFRAFARPSVDAGDILEITDNRFADRETGQYLCKSVVRTFSINEGLKQLITPERRLN